MSEQGLSNIIKSNHVALLRIKTEIEGTSTASADAKALAKAIWPVLQMYGYRDVNGSIYDGTAQAVFPSVDGEPNQIGWPDPRI